jgi:hypothetical protein
LAARQYASSPHRSVSVSGDCSVMVTGFSL